MAAKSLKEGMCTKPHSSGETGNTLSMATFKSCCGHDKQGLFASSSVGGMGGWEEGSPGVLPFLCCSHFAALPPPQWAFCSEAQTPRLRTALPATLQKLSKTWVKPFVYQHIHGTLGDTGRAAIKRSMHSISWQNPMLWHGR